MAQPEINFVKLTRCSVPSSAYFKKRINFILNYLSEKQKISLSIIFLTGTQIKKINSYWRGQKKATTVLTFSDYYEKRKNDLLIKEKHLGDIFFCPQEIIKMAKKEKIKLNDYWDKILVHSLLHLYRYHHQTKSAAQKMEAKEKIIIKAMAKI